LLPYRELVDALALTDEGADTPADARTGRNGRHRLAGLLRRSVFGRLAVKADQSANGSRTSTVSSRSRLVDSIATGAALNSSRHRTYLIMVAGNCTHERAPLVLS
jgi:hypothetical protein